MKISKRQLRRIIKEEEDLDPAIFDRPPIATASGVRYAHSNSSQSERKEALEFLEEIRAEGISDKRLVDYLIGKFYSGKMAQSHLRNFKESKL